MLEQLRLHTATHLRFFMRSRLVLGLTVAMIAMLALSLVPLFMMESVGGRFETLKYLASQLHMFAWAYGAVLALLGMSTHLRERTTRLVFTRPACPEVWIASILVASLAVAAVAHALIAAALYGMSLAWSVPYQTGFLWFAIDGVFESMIAVALLGLVAAAMHPAVAALAFVFFNESTFYELMRMTSAAIESGNTSVWLRLADAVVRGVYAFLPMLDPFDSNTSAVASSLRVEPIHWAYVGATGLYAFGCAGVCFLGTVWLLRRRAL